METDQCKSFERNYKIIQVHLLQLDNVLYEENNKISYYILQFAR